MFKLRGDIDQLLTVLTLYFTILSLANSIALLELTCPLDSEQHLQSARQNIWELKSLWNLLHFVYQDMQVSKVALRKVLDSALQKCIQGVRNVAKIRKNCVRDSESLQIHERFIRFSRDSV